MQIRKLTELPGIGPGLAAKIVRHFDGEAEALEAIRANPYALSEVPGVGFRRADAVAQRCYGVGEDDPIRHLYANPWTVAEAGGRMSREQYEARRYALGLRDLAYQWSGVAREGPKDRETVWLPEELEAECTLADFLRLARRVLPVAPTLQAAHSAGRYATALEGGLPEYLDPAQRQAAALLCDSSLPAVCLTGPAGTGKSTVIAEAVRILGPGQVRVMAFAGKAAQRVEEALQERGLGDYAEVSTIHRGLEYHPGWGFRKSYFTEGLIVIDEASMIPNRLLAEVVSRLPRGARLALVGDASQLPPIGLGFPFKDFIEAGVPTVRLGRNYRQEGQRGLFELAEAVRLRLVRAPEGLGEAVTVHSNLGATAFNRWCEALLTPELGDPLTWQAITFKNADRERMNLELQAILNPAGAPVFEVRTRALPKEEAAWVQVRVGDKVAVRANDYDLEVFNGQTGRVVGVEFDPEFSPTEPAEVVVEIGDRQVRVPMEQAPELLELAYCITGHKAQGSGWKQVFVLQPGAVLGSPNRWWYTALSRAQERLVVLTTLGPKSWWANATKPNQDEPSTLLARARGQLEVSA